MSTYDHDLPATPEQLKAIGMVEAEYSHLENIVETAIWQLANLDEDVGRAITTHTRLRMRLHMLRTLFRLRCDDEGAASRLDKLCDAIADSVSRERNNLIHALWVRGDYGSPMTFTVQAKGTLKLTVQAKGTLKPQKSGKHAREIQGVAAIIADRSRALVEFLHANGVVSPE